MSDEVQDEVLENKNQQSETETENQENHKIMTVAELEKFINKYPEDESLAQIYVDAAIEAINRFLGYDVELKDYETISYGDNGTLFELEAYPLHELKSVKENDVNLETSLFRIKNKNYLEYKFGRGIFLKNNLYTISYSAGFEKVPQEIKNVCLRIASVLWESEGGNLAVSSTSFADNGSRVFNNFKIERFLEEISSYKIQNLGV